MPAYRFVGPLDQPTGAFRLLDWMEANFRSGAYRDFRCLAAFAKIKPFYKLHDSIRLWNSLGKTSEAVLGVDHKGTSLQALQYALANFDAVYILHADYATFHPKLYIFSGPSGAAVYCGSGNFTSGGLETNFETGVIADYAFPADRDEFDKAMRCYTSLTAPPAACVTKLTLAVLDELNRRGLLLDETRAAPRSPRPAAGAAGAAPPLFGTLPMRPARPIPGSVMRAAASSAGIALPPVKTPGRSGAASPARPAAPVTIPVVTDGLVIQVILHRNGEIFLSKIAANQNPGFFGFPFSGMTVPKKPGNPTYPQRVPDPVVNIRVYDGAGTLANAQYGYSLNTVFYTRKSEIRITVTPAILSALHPSAATADHPILVMRASSAPGCDYELDFFAPGSALYSSYLAVCNQQLPSGGKPVPKRMGWI